MPKRCLPYVLSRVAIDNCLIEVALFALVSFILVVRCIEYTGVECGSAFGFVGWRLCL